MFIHEIRQMMFKDRKEAGILLGICLKKFRHLEPVIMAVPRGGVPVAYEVAKVLKAPMDVIFTKKIGHPNNREYAVGVVSSKGFSFDPVISGVPQQYLVEEVSRLQKLVKEKETAYHKEVKAQDIKKRWVILIDDGVATGNTIIAAANLLAQQHPAGIIVALPVGPDESIRKLNGHPVINEVVCVETPEYFEGVGQFYEDFDPVEDSEAIALLKDADTYRNSK